MPHSHIISLSFDDGFQKSCIKTAEIYERFNLSACFNVIATGHLATFVPPDEYHAGIPKGDFELWNELQARGHEIMPHGLEHQDLSKYPFTTAQRSVLRCLAIFSDKIQSFDARDSVFNFPYNASTAALEGWLPTIVKAFRTGGDGINPLPHQGQTKLTCTAYGPENCEQHLDSEIERLLSKPSGWLIYNTHGLDDEGWGPIRSTYLEGLLEKLLHIDTVTVKPVGQALSTQKNPL
jgi:hypothetical protein